MEQIDKIPKRPSGFVRAITWFIFVALLACAGYIAYNKFIWSQTFVVVGMSFECQVDKYLLSALKRVEDDLPTPLPQGLAEYHRRCIETAARH